MAITAKAVYDRVTQLAKAGTSGYQNQEEYNSKTHAAELTLVKLLSPLYDVNTQATEALAWLVVPADLTTVLNGVIPLPNDYVYFLSAEYINADNKRFPTKKILSNQIGMVRTSPVRGMNLLKDKVGWYRTKDGIITMPEQTGIKLRILYIKEPAYSVSVFTEVSTEDADYVDADGTAFGWPIQMFNILVYLILEQLGIEMKEQLLTEFAAYGITREMITP